MKYKDFKMLSMEEMKTIKGGNVPDDTGGCKTKCYKSNGSTTTEGNCTAGTTTIGNTTVTTCDCSLTGATSCY